jgi:anti-sigma factor RsiW
MDHLRFQSNQTAAAYVADGLDHETQEAFELHMMSCADCVQEVEVWRSLQGQLAANTTAVQECEGHEAHTHEAHTHEAHTHAAQPADHTRRRASAPGRARASASGASAGSLARARLAAVLIGVGLVGGGAGGWYARSAQGPWSDAERVDFYSLPAVTRGGEECSVVKLGPHASVLEVRVPGLGNPKTQQLVVRDSEGHDLTPADYRVRAQDDGSWLVRVRADMVRQQGLRFRLLENGDDEGEPRGCIVSSPTE